MSAYNSISRAALASCICLVALVGCSSNSTLKQAPVDTAPVARASTALPSVDPSTGLSADPRNNPFDPVTLNNQAVNLAAQGDYQGAVNSLERAVKMAPSRTDIAANLANLKAWMAQNNTAPRSVAASALPRIDEPAPSGPPPAALPPVWKGNAAPVAEDRAPVAKAKRKKTTATHTARAVSSSKSRVVKRNCKVDETSGKRVCTYWYRKTVEY